MEHFLISEASDQEAVVLGGFLFMVHARARYSDVVRIAAEPLLDICGGLGYVEAQAHSEHTKSGQGRARRRRIVPVVGSAFGVLGGPWAKRWLQARATEGLNAGTDGTLFPARSRDGWSRASADLAEANGVLRSWLVRFGVADSAVALHGTHACKARLLTWCAKAGLKSEHRRLLGGHAKPKEKMVLEYSRDALAGPLLSLVGVLGEVRAGVFNPDVDRSGRRGAFEPLAVRLGLATPWAEQEQEEEEIPDFEGSESSGGSGTPSGDEQEECEEDSVGEADVESELLDDGFVPLAVSMPPVLSGSTRRLFVHTRLRTLHASKEGDKEDVGRLACGVSKARTEEVESILAASFRNVCERCFRDGNIE